MYLAQRTVKICKENYLIFFLFFQLEYFEAGYVFCSEFFPDLNNWNGNVFIDQKCILKLNSLGAIDNVYWNGKHYFLRSWSYKEHHVKTWREQSSSVWGRGVKGDEGERGCGWLAPLFIPAMEMAVLVGISHSLPSIHTQGLSAVLNFFTFLPAHHQKDILSKDRRLQTLL